LQARRLLSFGKESSTKRAEIVTLEYKLAMTEEEGGLSAHRNDAQVQKICVCEEFKIRKEGVSYL
jgi:hypothetical protein